MRPLHLAILAACAFVATPALGLRRVYVANINANTVAVVDAASRTTLEIIPVGTQPDGVAVSPDGATVWVANFGDDTVSVIDTATDTVTATIAVGDGPVGIAMRPGGAEVYVANKLDDSVSVIDTASRSLAATISIRPDTGVNAIAFTPDGRRALVTASFGEKIRLIDPATRQVLDSVRVGREPNRIAVSPDSTRAYVSLFNAGAGGNPDDQNSLVAVDLATLQIVARAEADKPTGVALSADGRFVYVAQRSGVVRHDAGTLDVLGAIAFPVDVESVAALADPDLVLLARREADDLLFVAPGFGFDYTSTATPPRLRLIGGPFAIAALAAVEPDPLLAAIDAPTFGDKLDAAGGAAVRIRVDDGEQQLASWTLTLRAGSTPPLERVLAAGTTPVAGEVATIDGAGLVEGGSYELLLDAVSADGVRVARRVRFAVPGRRYALVPLSPSRVGFEPRYEMDAAGRRFVRVASSGRGFDVIESDTGVRHHVSPLQRFSVITQIVLSDDGRRVALNGYLEGSSRAFGTLDLETLALSLVPSFPIVIDSDAEARWLVGSQFGNVEDRYQLLDRVDGTRIFISDVEPFQGPVKCRPEVGNRARINADGTTVAFVTGSDLGFPEADGCTLFAYDRPSDSLRVVTAFGDRSVALPTIDDAGAQFGVVVRPDHTRGDNGQARATLVDLASGGLTDLLDGNPAGSSDAALSGDGRSVVISSCADLDPSVGNADANNELFRLDLDSGLFTQITDTTGGTVACQLNGGPSYDPAVSADANVLSFVMQDPTGAGPQRSLRNGFAFGAVRAVPVVDGNTPPKLEIVEGATTVAVGERIRLLVRSGDRDVDPISFFAQVGDEGLPDGAEFTVDRNDPQATFSWYPGANDAGEHTLRVGSFDGRGGENVQEVTLAVCRRIITRLTPATVAAAIFGDLPATCGDADANGDGVLSAADIVAVRLAAGG